MEDFGNSMVLNIIGGLATAAISFLLGFFWKKAIIPWHEERIYQGAEITGTWKSYTKYADGSVNEIIYLVKRYGHNISGMAYCQNGTDKGAGWEFEGTFKNLIVNATYSSVNRRALDGGSMSLMLVDNGKSLKGHLVYYHENAHILESAPVTLEPTHEPFPQIMPNE